MFRIGAFARIAGVSAKILRDYDELGLFRPAWVDPATGYRHYSPAQLPQLRRILALRVAGHRSGRDRPARVGRGGPRRRPRPPAGATSSANGARSTGGWRRSTSRSRWAAGRGRPDVVVRPVAAEIVATLGSPPGVDLGAAFYELEAHVRDLGVRAHRPPGALVDDGRCPGVRPGAPGLGRRADRLPAPAVRCGPATIIHHGRVRDAAGDAARPRAMGGGGRLRTGRTASDPLPPVRRRARARAPADYLVERSADFVTELQLPVA